MEPAHCPVTAEHELPRRLRPGRWLTSRRGSDAGRMIDDPVIDDRIHRTHLPATKGAERIVGGRRLRSGHREDRIRYTDFVKSIAFIGILTLFVVVVGSAVYRIGGDNDPATSVARQDKSPPDAQLSQRLAIAYGALRDAAGTRRLLEVHRYAAVAVDAIAGPTGRHGRDSAPAGGILPEDAAQVGSEPGLALRAHDTAPEQSPLRAAIDQTVTGGVAGWRTPADQYDAIDRAVAEYGPENDTISALPGESSRALAWALLTLKTDDVNAAHDIAERGADAAREALDIVRSARAAEQ